MTKPDDLVKILSPTDPAPPSGWLRNVRLPTKPGNASQPRFKEPHNALAHAWQTCLIRHYPLQYHKPLGWREGCMLAEFGRNVGDQAREVIEFAIANWKTFVSEAERKYGLFGSQPAEPHIAFFTKYHDCAINLILQSISKKKQHEEHEAQKQAGAKEAQEFAELEAKQAAFKREKPATKEEVDQILREFYADLEKSEQT
jgi:hypothetical protein